PDADAVPALSSTADGDDTSGVDDEDGVTFGVVNAGQNASVVVKVTNSSAAPAYLNAWIDFNNDGLLTGAGEQIATNIVVAPGTANQNQTISFAAPSIASGIVGARFRITDTQNPTSVSDSGNGEVEDHLCTVTCSQITLTPATLPDGAVNGVYNQALTATGGTAPYTWAITSGSLPSGMTLSPATGIVGGTPTATVNAQPVTVQVTDSTGCKGTRSYTLTVRSMRVGNLVWADLNPNGIRDSSEYGIPSLTMELWSVGTNGVAENGAGDDFKVRSDVQTDISGAYSFVDVPPGNLYVRIPTPPLFFPSGTAPVVSLDNGINNDNNGIQAGSGQPVTSPVIALALATEPAAGVDGDDTDGEATIDFGFAEPDACYRLSGNRFDNASFELTGTNPAAPKGGTPVAVNGFTSGTTGFGSNVNAYQWVGGTNGSSLLGLPVNRALVNVTTPGSKLSWVESLKARHGKRYLLLEGSNARIDMRAFNGGNWSSMLAAGSECEVAVYADTASSASSSFLLDMGAGASIIQVISGPAPAFYQNYIAPQSEFTGSTGTFSAGDYNGWSEATGNTIKPGWRKFTWRFRISSTATASEIDALRITLSSGTGSGPIAVDYTYLCSTIASSTLALGGTVWNDLNNDANQAATETGVGGAQVTLKGLGADGLPYTADDTTVAGPTTTGVTGNYTFSGLAPGNYYVVLSPPTSYPQSSGTPTDADNAVDKDNNGLQPGGRSTQIRTHVINLALGQETIADGDGNPDTDLTIDIGLWSGVTLGNLVWYDADNNGVRGTVAAEPGISGIAVDLLAAADNTVVASTTTDSNGAYGFQVFVPGSYFVRIAPNASYPIISAVSVSADNGVDNDNNGSQPGLAGTAISSMVFNLAAGNEPGTAGTTNLENTIDFGLRPCPTISITPASPLPSATQFAAYSQALSASGGTAPYAWSVTSGNLPAGLSLSSAGSITGTPSSAATPGAFNFTVQARDATGCVGTKSYALGLLCPTVTLNPATVASAMQYQAYSQTLTASNGSAPFVYSLTGTLPNGLSFSPSGVISGTPTGVSPPGNYSFTVSAVDRNGCTGSRGYTLTLDCPPIVINPTAVPPATQDQSYLQTLTASGGTAPYIWTVTGTMPSGLSLATASATTAIIVGTPTSVESRTFIVRAADKNGCFVDQSYTIAVSCPIITILPPSPLPPVTQYAAMTPVTYSATGGRGPYAFTLDPATNLPAGLTFNSGNASQTGTTTVTPGVYTFTMNVLDANNCPGSTAYSLTVGCAPINITTPSTLPQAMVGQTYAQALAATTQGTGVPAQVYAWSIESGTLPPGMGFNASSGMISGIPTAASTSNITVRATNQQLCAGTKSFTLTVGCPTIAITPSPLTDAYVNGSYSLPLIAWNGNPPYTWAMTSGTLPAGLTFNAGTGTISGTPTTTGSATLAFEVTDKYGCKGTLSSALNVKTMGIGNLVWDDCNNNGLRDAGEAGLSGVDVTLYRDNDNNTRDAADTLVFTQTTGTGGAYAFTNIPPGTYYVKVVPPTSNPMTGGTPGTQDNRIDNDNNGSQPGALNSALYSPMIVLSPGAEPTNDGDTDANTDWTVDFGLWSGIDVGNLVWNDVDNSHSVNGSETGVSGVSVELVSPGTDNAIGGGGSAADAVVATTTTNSNGNYAFKVFASGRYYVRVTPPVAFPLATSLAGGDDGVDGDNNGWQPGGVTTIINSPVINLAACAEPGPAGTTNSENTMDFGLRVCPTLVISPSALPNAIQYSAYNQTLTASAGSAPYTWSVVSGSLPPGLALASTGAATAAITGAPNASAALVSYNVTVRARDTAGCLVDQPMAITVVCPVITIDQSTVPVATQYTGYSTTLTATTTGTTGVAYNWSMVSGTLPNGLSLGASGVISGTPSGVSPPGLYNFTVKAMDPNGCFGTRGFTMTLSCPNISVGGSTPAGVQDTAYSASFSASGATSPYIWTVSLGSLPAGLSLNSSTGVISGTPTVVQSSTFTLRATDSNVCYGERVFTLAIGCPVINISPASLTAVTQYAAMTPVTFTASGGRSPYGWALNAGSTLPTGLTLSSGGVLSGTPTAAPATYIFTVKVTDNSGCPGTRAYALVVNCPPITLAFNPVLPWSPVVGTSFSGQVSASGGTTPYSFSLGSGILPSGLSLAAGTGIISGIPSSAGTYTFNLVATDKNGCAGSQNVTVTATCPVVTISPSPLPSSALQYASYNQTLTASGGSAPYVWGVTAGALPAGVTLNSSTGLLSGTPTAAPGGYSFTAEATDKYGCKGSSALSLTVVCPPLIIDPPSLAGATQLLPYSATIVASGGTSPYTYSVSSGTLPAGLTLSSSTGVISGTPTTVESQTFTMHAVDVNGCVGDRAYVLVVSCSFFPLQDGVAVTTNSGASQINTAAGPADLTSGIDPNAFTFGIIDVRSRPGLGALNWLAPKYHGPAGNEWNVNRLGHVFGTAIDKDGNVYVTASSSYSGGNVTGASGFVSTGIFPYGALGGGSASLAAAGTIYKIDKTTGVLSVLAQLPQQSFYPAFDKTAAGTQVVGGVTYYLASPTVRTGPGLGSISYDTLNTQLFVSNFEDGKIYRLSTAGAALSNFDPLSADSGAAGAAPLGERVWGLGVYNSRLYYGVWVESYNTGGGSLGEDNGTANNIVRSVALSAGGDFVASSDRLEVTLPAFTGSGVGRSNPVSDVEFDASGNMMVCERAMINATTPGVGAARTLVYAPLPGNTWATPRQYHVGSSTTAEASTGGGDFGYSTFNNSTCKVGGCDQFLWMMGDALRLGSSDGGSMPSGYAGSRYAIHGLQGTPLTTAYPLTSAQYFAGHNLVDLDEEFIQTENLYNGDVDVFRHSPIVTPGAPPQCVPLGSSFTLSATIRDVPPWVVKPITYQWYRVDNATTGVYTAIGTSGTISVGSGPYTISRSITATATEVDKYYFLQVGYGDVSAPCTMRSPFVGPVKACGAIGNLIFRDNNRNGRYDTGDVALSGVTLELYADTNGDGLAQPGAGDGVSLLTTTTNASGEYLFQPLPEGKFFVRVPAAEFQSGGHLAGLVSSTGVGSDNGLDDDADENGVDDASPAVNGINSTVITLTNNGEPVDGGTETGVSKTTDNADDNNSDLTVDLGFMCPDFVFSPASLTAATQYQAYGPVTISATGGSSPYAWALSSGALPTGTSFNGSGVLSGTPTSAPGTYSFATRATDAFGCFNDKAYTLNVLCPTITVNPSSLPGATQFVTYSSTISASGGTSPYTFSVTGALPAGITLNTATGVLSGASSATPGSFPITVTAKDVNNCTGTRGYTLVLACPTITVNPASLPPGTQNVAYDQTVAASGGTAPYVFSVSAGTLPTGLTLNASTGRISGTPTVVQSVGFTIQAADAGGCFGTRAYVLPIGCPAIIWTPATLADATQYASYTVSFSVSGATPPITFAVNGGSTLPAGLTFNAGTATLSGTPTAAPGAYTFTMKATDAVDCSSFQPYTLTIVCPPVTITTASPLPLGTLGSSYTPVTFAAITEGTNVPAQVYSWRVSVGSLPTGMTLSSAGVLSGTPTVATTASFTVEAANADGCVGTKVFSLTTNCPTLTINPATLPDGFLQWAYSTSVSTSGGTAPYSYNISAGSLPPGVTMSSAGAFSGAPTSAGTYSFTVRSTDTNGCQSTKAFSILVRTGSIGDVVWNDSNNNGIYDTLTELGIGGATVQLFKDNGDNVANTTGDVQVGADKITGVAGTYIFTGLSPGKYYVKVQPVPGFPYSGGTPVTLDSQINNDNNGSQPGGPGTAYYSPVINLMPGTESTADGDTNADTERTIDFGLYSGGIIGDLVFRDDNCNSIRDASEPGIAGVSVMLYSTVDAAVGGGDDTLVSSQATNSTGNYGFQNLRPGRYYVAVTPPTAYPLASPAATGDNGVDNDNNGTQIGPGQPIYSQVITYSPAGEPGNSGTTNTENTIDFGLCAAGLSVGNLVWIDSNNNGFHDTSESGLDGVQLEIWRTTDTTIGNADDVKLYTTTTASGGQYQFAGLGGGMYYIKIPQPPPAFPEPGGTPVTLDNGVDNDNNGSQPSGSGTAIYSPVITLASGTEPGTTGGT
ncbi:MAG: putative Ig protein, partial [Verrucomicrobiaceae bacterium]|nr:putative Ig protein [Verrucomicrobiaceae bacterium]